MTIFVDKDGIIIVDRDPDFTIPEDIDNWSIDVWIAEDVFRINKYDAGSSPITRFHPHGVGVGLTRFHSARALLRAVNYEGSDKDWLRVREAVTKYIIQRDLDEELSDG